MYEFNPIFQYLFQHVFCPENDVPPDKAAQVSPGYFLGWMRTKVGLLDSSEALEKTKLSQEAWDNAWQLIDSPDGAQWLLRWWYFICLGDRPAPKNELHAVQAVMLLTYTDGTIVPISSFVSRETLVRDMAITDGHVASVLNNHVHDVFIGSIVEQGLDKLHAEGKNYRGKTPLDPYEVFCGLVLQAIKDGVAGGKLSPEYLEAVMAYFRLAQSLIRPPMPPHIKAAIRTVKQKGEAVQKGGWDIPG